MPSAAVPNDTTSRTEDFAEFLRQETTGGKLLLLATALALTWANVAPDAYRTVWDASAAIGPAWLELDLSLGDWAADGLLAVFFFVAGLELKRELVVGELADRKAALLPLVAAVGGMVLPAVVALVVSGGAAGDGGAWAIPVATDIAFALGVLALAGAMLPTGVRVLLLSIAVIDDLLAITLIAILFTKGFSALWLLGALAGTALFAAAFRARLDRAAVLWSLALVVWICVHASGVHATVAGILLAAVVPVRPRKREEHARAEDLEHRLHPVSAGFAVPIFALAATGIPLGAASGALDDPVALGVLAGLAVGKVLGVFGAARLTVAAGLGTLPEGVRWADVVPVAVLGGIGYTVSLLVTRLSLPAGAAQERAAAAVLMASVAASLVALVLLRRRSRA